MKLNKNIIISFLIIFLLVLLDYSLNKPTIINEFIAKNIYKSPANVSFTDDNFYKCVIDSYNKLNKTTIAYTTSLSDSQLKSINTLVCYGNKKSDSEKPKNVNGIEKLTGLSYLYLTELGLTSIDLSTNSNLKWLFIAGNDLTELDLSNNPLLSRLDTGYWCSDSFNSQGDCDDENRGNKNLKLNLSNNPALTELIIANPYTELDLQKNINLSELQIYDSFISKLDLSNNNQLKKIKILSTDVNEIIFDENELLTELEIHDTLIESLDLTKIPNLVGLRVTGNSLISLDLGNKPDLKYIYVAGNLLESLDVSKVPKLAALNLSSGCMTSSSNGVCPSDKKNNLKSLNLNNNSLLTTLIASNMSLEALDLSNNSMLTTLNISNNFLSNLDLSNNSELISLDASDNNISSVTFGDVENLESLTIDNNVLSELNLNNAINLNTLVAYNNNIKNINLQGTENLQYLYLGGICRLYGGSNCDSGNLLETINLTDSANLERLSVSNNKLTSLDLSNNLKLKYLVADNNNIENINIKENNSLNYIYLENNKISNIEFNPNNNIKILELQKNNIETINLSGLINLMELNLAYNSINKIDISKLSNLRELNVIYNNLNNLDLSNNSNLNDRDLNIYGNPFTESIYLYKGDSITLNEPVIYPSHITKNLSWKSSNDKVTVNDNILFADNSGIFNITGSSSSYKAVKQINVIEATSDKYTINNEENYIYTKTDLDEETILKNINLNFGTKEIVDDKIFIKYNNNILKTLDIINVNSEEYDLSKNYIYTGLNTLDTNKINVKNGSAVIKDNKLQVIYNNMVLDEYDLVNINSSEYDLNDSYIYLKLNEFNIDNINVTNASKKIENNKLQIIYNDIILDEIFVIKISSVKYNMQNEYILTGGADINLDDIQITNGILSQDDQYIYVNFNNDIIDKYYKSDFIDENFYKCVIDGYNQYNNPDIDYTKHLKEEELLKIKTISCWGNDESEKITSMMGLSELKNLTNLVLYHHKINKIDLTQNLKITDISIVDNSLVELDVSKNILLKKLSVVGNKLTELNVDKNVNLTYLNVGDHGSLSYGKNKLTQLDVSNNLELTELYVSYNQLEEIDVSNNIKLTRLELSSNKLNNIDLSNNIDLISLKIDNNNLTEIDISNNSNLSLLDVSSNNLKKLDVTKNPDLIRLVTSNNEITEIDVSNNLELVQLTISDNKLNKLDVSENNKLNSLQFHNNSFNKKIGVYLNTKLDLSNYETDLVKLPLGKTGAIIEINSENEDMINGNDFQGVIKGNYKVDIKYDHDIVTDYEKHLHYYYILFDIFVIEATSNIYDINSIENYIYTGTDTDSNIILENINLNYGEASIENNKLLIKYNNEVIKTFNIINVSSEKYDLSKEYIFDFDNDTINVINGSYNKKTQENILEIKYNDIILDTYLLIDISSNFYDLSNSTLKVMDSTIEELLSKINCINCEAKIYDGNNYLTTGSFDENYILRLMYNNEVLKEYNLTYAVNGVWLSIENAKLGLERKKTIQLEAIIKPANAENKKLIWSSSDENVVTVNETGLVTSVGLGNATITVTTDEGRFADTVEVEVVEIITYAVNYNDGDNTDTKYYEENEEVILKSDATKEGYTLVCWEYNDICYQITEKIIMPAQDILLNAKWAANKYEVTYEANDGSIEQNSFEVTYDETYGKLFAPTKKGYTFKGWYLEETFETEITKDSIVKTTQDHMLYTKWEINNYKLTINPNGGEYSEEKNITINYNETTEIETPTRVGYTFKGWEVTGAESAINDGTFTMGISDSTLTAKWAANKYKVIYEVNGGSIEQNSFEVTYDETYGILLVPTKQGYTFKGWYLEDSFETEIIKDSMVKTTKDQMLYAKWEINSYELNINPNGGEYSEEKNITINYNATTEIEIPTRVGYTFKGWEVTGEESTINDGTFTMGISNTTLTAKWELIIPNIEEISIYNVKDNLITNISLGTKINDLKLGLDNFYTIKIYYKNDKEKKEGILTTGDKIKIYLNETLVSEYVIAIKGDINGDGKASVADVTKLYQYLKKKITMDNCFIEAGNIVSSDEVIKANDIAKLYQYIKNKIDKLD